MKYLKDDEFIRGKSPMTKEEIRILSIAKLEIYENSTVLDIGAGTGSVSIQLCRCCPNGSVTAIEKNTEAIEILFKNEEKFSVTNLVVIEGEALGVEKDINTIFDGIFIGGSGGNIEQIIKRYETKLKRNGKIVLNFITIDNLYKAISVLKELDFEVECSQISVSKTRISSYMFFANNPIFILSGKKLME